MKLLNIHNAASQYRAPLFVELGRRHEQEVVFFQPSRSWREPLNELAYSGYRSQVLQGTWPQRLWALGQALFTQDYDVLLMAVGGRLELLLVWLAAAWRNKPLVLWEETWAPTRSFFHGLARLFLPALFKRADAVLVLGAHVQRYWSAQGVDPQKLVLAPQVVDARIFGRPQSAAQKSAARRSFKVERGRLALLYVGRLIPEKGLRILAQALASPGAERWDLILCGRGPLEAELLGDPALQGRVRSLGHQKSAALVAIYAAADLLVLPSVSRPRFKEPWGLVVNEAFCQGLPALTSDAVGAAAGGLVQQGRTGWIFPEGDSAALAKALQRLGSGAPLRKRLGAEAKRRVLATGYDDMADRFDKAFALALAKRPAR